MPLDFIILCLTSFKLFYLSASSSRIVTLIVSEA
jgi:hypothetical protein